MQGRMDKSKRGFTVVEGLMASAVLTTAVIGIIVPFVAGGRTSLTTRAARWRRTWRRS